MPFEAGQSTVLIAGFLAGAFLCNAIPHWVAGVQGARFPTPFARPPGVGDSPALVNVLWGASNLAVGLALLHAAPVALAPGRPLFGFAAGFFVMGIVLAVHFGRVMARRRR